MEMDLGEPNQVAHLINSEESRDPSVHDAAPDLVIEGIQGPLPNCVNYERTHRSKGRGRN
jgi:hypothetical protein